MRDLPDQSVDLVLTSPPYAMQRAAAYGGIPEPEYPAWTAAWMREAGRILRPRGSVAIVHGPPVRNGALMRYHHDTTTAILDDGWTWIIARQSG